MSTLNTVNITNGTDSITVEGAVKGSAKAWVNFNGTGTVAIRASYNVSSITDNGTGNYTINFTSALADANFSAAAIVGDGAVKAATRSTTSFQITTPYLSNTAADQDPVLVAIFR
jgi:hypothetical protein